LAGQGYPPSQFVEAAPFFSETVDQRVPQAKRQWMERVVSLNCLRMKFVVKDQEATRFSCLIV
jgi:hypothetical protein